MEPHEEAIAKLKKMIADDPLMPEEKLAQILARMNELGG